MKPEQLQKIAENSSAVAFHKFVLLSKGREHDLFCFFEGRDSQYYSSRIKSYTRRHYHPISCGSKKSVLETYGIIKKHKTYGRFLQAYFIDRDFDPKLDNEDIYETPCYSVENFYVNDYCLSEILKNEFLLTEIDSEYHSVMHMFDCELNSYNSEVVLFNAWYASLKQKKHKENIKTTGVCLADNLPKGFVCIKIGSISSSYDLNKIRSTFPDAIDVSEEDVLGKKSEFLKGSTSDMLRGKYQFAFFYEFIMFLIEDANKTKSFLKKKTKLHINKVNMYAQLSQYAKTTDCLVRYLEKFTI